MTNIDSALDLPTGWCTRAFDALDSTNAELKRRVAAGEEKAEGVIVTAARQSAGRGRHGRAWVSPPGNLYASVLVAAPAVILAPEVGLVAAVAVTDAVVAETGLQARCKWPNDILLGGRKLCGILPELVTDPAGRSWIVLGIGINLQPVEVADALYPVTSLAEHDVKISAPAMLAAVARCLARRLALWRRDGLAPIAQAWTRVGPMAGAAITVQVPGREKGLNGRYQGLDDQGAMLLETNGGVTRVLAGDVLAEPIVAGGG